MSIALLAVSSCGDGLSARADQAEAEVGERIALMQRYDALEAPLPGAKPGAGRIAGKPVMCGTVPGSGARAIRVEGLTIAESDLGRDPEIFEEFWRRAGC